MATWGSWGLAVGGRGHPQLPNLQLWLWDAACQDVAPRRPRNSPPTTSAQPPPQPDSTGPRGFTLNPKPTTCSSRASSTPSWCCCPPPTPTTSSTTAMPQVGGDWVGGDWVGGWVGGAGGWRRRVGGWVGGNWVGGWGLGRWGSAPVPSGTAHCGRGGWELQAATPAPTPCFDPGGGGDHRPARPRPRIASPSPVIHSHPMPPHLTAAVDTSGEVVEGPSNPNIRSDVLALFHYAVKSEQEYREKMARGGWAGGEGLWAGRCE